jgi:hypothetical protein
VTPDSNGASVYHHHVQHNPPFTIGCFGPSASGGLVTLDECRALYPGSQGCGGDDIITVLTPTGPKKYDLWCPCYDASGSNVVAGSGTTPAATTAGVYKVDFSLRAAGDMADYTAGKLDLMRQDLAVAAGVLYSDVEVAVTSGSVVVSVTIIVHSAATAAVVTSTLTPKLATASAASNIFSKASVAIESVTTQPTTTGTPAAAAMGPGGGPPPGLRTGTLVAIIAGGAVGALLLVGLVVRWRKKGLPCCGSKSYPGNKV